MSLTYEPASEPQGGHWPWLVFTAKHTPSLSFLLFLLVPLRRSFLIAHLLLLVGVVPQNLSRHPFDESLNPLLRQGGHWPWLVFTAKLFSQLDGSGMADFGGGNGDEKKYGEDEKDDYLN